MADHQHPLVVVVDQDDKVIGSKDIAQAYNDNDIVRIARCFLVSSKGEVLIQQRSANMHNWPNLWQDSSAGHVDAGEDYDQAADREMREELGITTPVDLQPVGHYFVKEHLTNGTLRGAFHTVFTAKYDGSTNPDSDEVSALKWVKLSDLDTMLVAESKDFMPGTKRAWAVAKPSIQKLISIV